MSAGSSYAATLFDLRGKVVVVTGASEGIGKHWSMMLARVGANVVLGSRTKVKLDAVVDSITKAGGTAVAHALDVTKLASIGAFCDFAVATFGRIDVLVNNAGVQVGDKPTMKHTEEDWDFVLNTNLKGAFFMAQACAAIMKRNGRDAGGSIINVASVLGVRPQAWLVSYSASKAGLLHLTHTLALDWARHGIRVNSIAPGYILSEINREIFEEPSTTPGGFRYGLPDKSQVGRALIKNIPQRRLGDVADLDGALLLLASGAGRWMTSSTVTVDGGHMHASL